MSVPSHLIPILTKKVFLIVNPNSNWHPVQGLRAKAQTNVDNNKNYQKAKLEAGISYQAIEEDAKRQLSDLLAEGANVDCEDHHHWTPIMHALYFNRVELAQYLFLQGASVAESPKLASNQRIAVWIDKESAVFKLWEKQVEKQALAVTVRLESASCLPPTLKNLFTNPEKNAPKSGEETKVSLEELRLAGADSLAKIHENAEKIKADLALIRSGETHPMLPLQEIRSARIAAERELAVAAERVAAAEADQKKCDEIVKRNLGSKVNI